MFNLHTVAQTSHHRGDLAKYITSVAYGRPVHVIGSGPSALNYVHDPDAYVIVTNAAVQKWGHLADLHVMIEAQVWVFPWALDQGEFGGRTVLALDCIGKNMPDEARRAYSDRWWQSALWAKRHLYHKGMDMTELGSGPVQFAGRGGVGMCAIHLGNVANRGGEIHTWGMEFYFPDGVQHFYGDTPYGDTQSSTGLVSFAIIDGEACSGVDGPYISTPYFIASSQAIRKWCRLADINLIDHSGGLLEPSRMVCI